MLPQLTVVNNDLVGQHNENESKVNIDINSKRKKLTTIDWITASNETINETAAIEEDYTFVQRKNKRQKIEINSNQKRNKENYEHSKAPPSSSAKRSKDGKNCIEPNKLRLKYEKIHANTVQKLNAQADQLRMEINTLRTALANEQNAVRTLR